MKILHIVWSLTFGGIETMLVNIANIQAKLGANVHIIIINDLVEESILKTIESNVTLHCIDRKQHSKSLAFIKQMNKLIDSIEPNYIHLHSASIWGLLSEKNKQRGVSLTLHDMTSKSQRRYGFLHKIYPVLDLKSGGNTLNITEIPTVFTISQAVHDDLLVKYGVDSIIVNNGIVCSKFAQRNDNLNTIPMKLIQVSRLEHNKKGQDLLIQAASKLRGQIEVNFIGNGSSMDYLKNLACELNISEYVHFLGQQTQDYIASHLSLYDLYVQPSRFEGFGLTVAEAMAAKLPVLVSEGQGPSEVTCGNKYGWTFENGNAEDLTNVIRHIIDNYHVTVSKAEKGCRYVYETYDVSITAKKYLENYGIITKK